VLPAGQKYDPTYDKLFVIGVGDYQPLGEMLVINGNPQPPVLPLQVGAKYRFRLINITPDSTGMQIKLLRAGVPDSVAAALPRTAPTCLRARPSWPRPTC